MFEADKYIIHTNHFDTAPEKAQSRLLFKEIGSNDAQRFSPY